MGERFFNSSAAARAVYERAGEVLGRDVAALCFRGSPDMLKDTRNAQVAVVVTNLAAAALLAEAGLVPDVVAGHSVGEFAAVVAAGALDADDVVAAIARRAELMSAVEARGTMAAVSGVDPDRVRAICDDVRDAAHPVVLAVFNASRSVVVSGDRCAVDEACQRASSAGARVTELAVSHAFHSPLMRPVVGPWASYLARVPFRDPTVTLYANVSGSPVATGDAVRAALTEQVTAPVLWRQTILNMAANGVTEAIEAGDSRVLGGFNRGDEPAFRTVSLGDRRGFGEVLAAARASP